MPGQEKKGSGKTPESKQESKELARLLGLLNTPASKQQLPSIDVSAPSKSSRYGQLRGTGKIKWPPAQPSCQEQSTEALALEKFSKRYQNDRVFSKHPMQGYFSQIFTALIKHRLCSPEWTERAPPENILRVVTCLRMLMRDPTYQKMFFDLDGLKLLAERLEAATHSYLTFGEGPYVVDILKEMTNIFQKLSVQEKQKDWLVACQAHKSLVLLLSANDVIVLHCSLYALISLTQSPEPRAVIAELHCVETLLRILQEYDNMSKSLAARLLRSLCADSQAREQVKIYDGVPVLLSLLHYDSLNLLWNVVWILVQLCEDPDMTNDIRLMGGIPLLLSLLHDRKFETDRTALTQLSSSAGATPGHGGFQVTFQGDESEVNVSEKDKLSLKAVVCTALTELVLNDTNAYQIVQTNGVYLIGLLIMPPDTGNPEIFIDLQRTAFRTLRFLFSMERNRQLFKRLFPPDLFEMFIDIGHYIRDINAYKQVVDKLNSLPKDQLQVIQQRIFDTNQNKEPNTFISNYAVYELLGSGAFGNVYKVKKKDSSGTFLALKEINVHNPALGKTAKEKDKSIGDIVAEINIIREQLKHPNIVRYYKTFTENDRLYILMDLIEGAPLGEHFNSLKEKGERFPEDRIWNIFLQIVLALRYLHKERKIVHRDLKPDNIMLGENDKVTITDFGLARQKSREESKMTSVVGTILYSCPEIVKSEPYTEKADVWASGCILYQMCALQPPFYSSNMLSLATKIVNAEYEPLPEDLYSQQITGVIGSCLTSEPEERPDIVQVAALISDKLLVFMDQLRVNQVNMEKKLERERKRTQRHFVEANRNMQNYHRLFLASQERYDKLVSLQSSGGASSFKGGGDSGSDLSDSVFAVAAAYAEANKKRENGSSTLADSEKDLSSSSGSDQESDSGTAQKSKKADKKKDLSSSGSLQLPQGSPGKKLSKPTPPTSPRAPHGARRALQLDGADKSTFRSRSNSTEKSSTSSPPRESSDRVVLQHQTSTSSTSSDGNGGERRTQSSTLELMRRRLSSNKGRPNSASAGAAMLTISPRKVRQIKDPIQEMLHQLHKIIYISQLPPTLTHNPRRRVVEKFMRALFSPQSSSFNLKSELKKLLTGSRDLIDLNFAPWTARQATAEEAAIAAAADRPALTSVNSVEEGNISDVGITYEQMQNIIESVLAESGYYDVSPATRNRMQPLGPIERNRSSSTSS
ncbi:PREDICTED: serine/threonine-protein kinase Nek10-like [Branchiostoma belcheri]|uniref:Serine/threonine-protein kinase Nek10-like n=1 Tax=Branchiostoma belcheri TaxID=7741 RepID=A0A6P4XAI5_BRABE|nr:PREDICTED: serine/threonine-protein kinase Nek10-like [Branchiostoma belcheri]